ncbi:MAG TPA: class I SAM-dependent methyltransferase [Polyangiaceae bacterium]|nr:class I SAM-dependent methyltransferase [Polyangiaceae bacterium]
MNLPMVSRACPVCGSDNQYRVFKEAAFDASRWGRFAFASRKTPEYMHYRLLECRRCDVLYANPLPTRESLEAAYREADFDSGEEARYAGNAYAEFLPQILSKLTRREAALDIGTGDGAFLEHLLRSGFQRVVGVEPSKAPVDAAAPSVRGLIRQSPFRRSDFEPGSFSLITCFQTMEHVYEPLELCQSAFELLHPGGALFLVCHDRRALSARVLGTRSPIYDIEHLQLFSRESLSYALRRAGYNDIATHSVVNRYPISYWTKLFPLPPRAKGAALGALKKSGLGSVSLSLSAGNFAAIGYKR